MVHMSNISVSSGRSYSRVLCSRINSIKLLNSSSKCHVSFSEFPFRASRSLWRSASRSYILAQAQEDDKGSTGEEDETFALAPSKPNSAVGEMAAYYLQMQPHLFRSAVESELEKMKESRESASGKEDKDKSLTDDPSQLVLFRRMEEVKRAEEARAIEDLMYICILEKFQEIGVQLLPAVEPIDESIEALKALTEGVHTKEALEMVKEHVLSILGPASMAYANTPIKMSKLQAAQVYAASIMFGYFLRRVDSRFQLAKQVGILPEDPEDTVERLERLFALADDADGESDLDSAVPPEPKADQDNKSLIQKKKGALRKYVESFDQEAMMAMAKLVTVEAAGLVERQTNALFGDVRDLQNEMQSAVGSNASSMEELMERVQKAVSDDSVQTVTLTVGTQRRAVLEAVAYGCFLRDVELWVERDYALLTAISSDTDVL